MDTETATLADLRRAGRAASTARDPALLRAWAAAERDQARALVEASRRRCAEVAAARSARSARPGPGTPDLAAMWTLRHALGDRVAQTRRAATAHPRTLADPGAALADCEVVERLLETWDAVTLWADDPDAGRGDAWAQASVALHRVMCRLAARCTTPAAAR
ncbi:hypothetical protein [Geodermatophilus marinus]|uniref:hypothetical protein n=1 Tax=Geodermatophilus sp. LHW52908 TaxID=2303986 RepID=UPI000E3EAB48|nr:hypothetical protein [Geodermatophilus sp. LHW52908]RFU20228.1 hypothetical protein D0Z06_17310 [Geodermatophilus sp. LHW52908]